LLFIVKWFGKTGQDNSKRECVDAATGRRRGKHI
jgi:hypothetical protein